MDNQFNPHNINLNDPETEYYYIPFETDKSTGFNRLQKLILYNHKVNQYESIKELITTQPELINQPNTAGWTALAIACANSKKYNLLDIVKLLLDCPYININHQNKHGSHALISAVMFGDSHIECIELLLGHPGLNINLQNNSGVTALTFASRYSDSYSSVQTVELLLKYGAVVSLQNLNGLTAIMMAVFVNNDIHVQTAKILLNYCKFHSDINMTDNNGLTALDYAINFNYLEIVDLLYANGTSIAHTRYTMESLQIENRLDIINIIKSYDVPTKGVMGDD